VLVGDEQEKIRAGWLCTGRIGHCHSQVGVGVLPS
jgi:hypothetical protein